MSADSSDVPVTQGPMPCRGLAVAVDDGEGLYALQIEIHNRGAEPLELPTYEPFLAFSVRATADGEPVVVHQPTLDIPVNPTTIRLPPRGNLTLPTPIQLRIAEGAEPSTDGFVWTIAHAPAGVSLELELHLPTPFEVVCPVVLLER